MLKVQAIFQILKRNKKLKTKLIKEQDFITVKSLKNKCQKRL